MESLKATIQVDILNMQAVKDAVEIMQEIVNDDRIAVEVRSQYRERFDAIPWKLPTHDEFEQDYRDVAERMRESRERMNNRTWRLIGQRKDR
jgi:hypothetical protein